MVRLWGWVNESMKYSRNVDLLVASIIYLGTSRNFWGRSPMGMAHELGLEGDTLLRMFESFPVLFRRTQRKSENGQHYYVLQARHAQREDGSMTADVDHNQDIAPLDKDKLDMLINFVLQRTEQETTGRRAWLASGIAVVAAVVSAGTAISVALLKKC